MTVAVAAEYQSAGQRLVCQELLDILDTAASSAQMNDRVAVWAHRPQISNRVNFVLLANLREPLDVVDVDEPLGERTVRGTEAEPADNTSWPIVLDATAPSNRIALVSIDSNLASGPLNQLAC